MSMIARIVVVRVKKVEATTMLTLSAATRVDGREDTGVEGEDHAKTEKIGVRR
jgi:hypothetical protein